MEATCEGIFGLKWLEAKAGSNGPTRSGQKVVEVAVQSPATSFVALIPPDSATPFNDFLQQVIHRADNTTSWQRKVLSCLSLGEKCQEESGQKAV